MRIQGWDLFLIQALDYHRDCLFEWGESDCWSLMMDCVFALHGEEPFASYTRKYSTANGAAASLRRAGFQNIREALDSEFEHVPHSIAQRGDLCLIEPGEGFSLPPGDKLAGGVVMGARVHGKSMSGLRSVAMDPKWTYYAVR